VKTLLWDLDGTLLTTGGAGAAPFKVAIESALGQTIEFSVDGNSGLTDHQIAAKYIQGRFDRDELNEAVQSIVEGYASKLKDTFSKSKVKPFPGIQTLLCSLEEDGNFRQMVVTGNCKTGAFEKLRSASLLKYFTEESIFFSVDLSPRSKIVMKAMMQSEISGRDPILIGDTRHDLDAAIQCSLPFILVSHEKNEVDFEWNTYDKAHFVGPNWTAPEFIELINSL
jgi:phosphoglycolate phosphatase